MKKIVVLGAGMMGAVIAVNLCRQYHVTVVDRDRNQLNSLETQHPVETRRVDLSIPRAAREVIRDHDLVIGALPGFMGFEILKTVIRSGKDVVDISFFAEDPFKLDTLAKKQNVTVVVDCGVAPGMSNIILGYCNQRMSVSDYECLVGGLPVKRRWPYQYKAPFSPIDVIEEYTRPARVVENGKVVVKPALSDAEYVEIDPVGTLEAFNTDGLRTLLKTMTIANMKEKTLRYPGHIETMRVLGETGFFSKEPVEVSGSTVRPIDITAKLLSSMWRPEQNEPDFTVMQITIRGKEGRRHKEYVYRLFDRFDEHAEASSMARTTGYTCTAVARLILDGGFARKGVCPPEYIGAEPNRFHRIMADLQRHNVNYTCEERIIEGA